MTEPGYAAAFDLYHQHGWVPIKLKAHTKYPPPAGFTGDNGADPSYADMTAWAEEEPGGNLANRLSAEYIGIDVDDYGGKNGGATMVEAEKRWGRLPYSPRSSARPDDPVSGIRLYRIPAGMKLVDKLGFPELGLGGVEIIQRHHRYVVCWPSIHPVTGQQYRWYGLDGGPLSEPPYRTDVPDLPRTWLEALTEPVHDSATLDDGACYNIREALTEGQPSRRVAAKLGEAVLACDGASRHDHTRDNVLALLRYGRQGDTGVLPALKKLQNVFAAAVGPDRAGGHTEAVEEFADFVNSDRVAALLAQPDHDKWVGNLGEPPIDGASLLGEMITAAQLDTMTFAPLVEHVPRLIPEGFGILAGSPKVGKSWFATGIGLACAQGGTALGGIDVTARHVLLLALEDGHRRLQARMRRLNHDQPLPPRLHILTRLTPGTVIATITEWLQAHHADPQPPLAILDTLGKARPQRRPGDDPYIADYLLGSHMKATIDAIPGAALLAVHHTRKMGADDWLDTISGTQGIAGSADSILALTRKRHSDEGTLAVTGRDIIENEYAIKTDCGVWSLDGMDILDAAATIKTRAERDQQARLGSQSLDAMRFVGSRPATTPAELATHLNIDNKLSGNLLARLAESGYIAKPSRGTYVPLPQENTSESDESDENAGQGIW